MNKYKIGDKVRCLAQIRNLGVLKLGEVYTVYATTYNEQRRANFLSLEKDGQWYREFRFEREVER